MGAGAGRKHEEGRRREDAARLGFLPAGWPRPTGLQVRARRGFCLLFSCWSFARSNRQGFSPIYKTLGDERGRVPPRRRPLPASSRRPGAGHHAATPRSTRRPRKLGAESRRTLGAPQPPGLGRGRSGTTKRRGGGRPGAAPASALGKACPDPAATGGFPGAPPAAHGGLASGNLRTAGLVVVFLFLPRRSRTRVFTESFSTRRLPLCLPPCGLPRRPRPREPRPRRPDVVPSSTGRSGRRPARPRGPGGSHARTGPGPGAGAGVHTRGRTRTTTSPFSSPHGLHV